jgi:predicted nuclease of predicted toxin-antitoxin system
MAGATDIEILTCARERVAVVVTLDADFHAILAVSSGREPSVIRLRIQSLDGSRVAEIVQGTLRSFGEELSRGALVTVKKAKTTCRRLPIGDRSE